MTNKDKNNQTILTYQSNFDKYVERTPKEIGEEFKIWMDHFLQKLPRAGKIFEVGSASGRDARYFDGKGFKVLCTDVIPQALSKLSQEGFETAQYDFRDKPHKEWQGQFDGFFANAVLLHASEKMFVRALRNLLEILKPNGIGAFSLKSGEGEEMTEEKMDAPRFFKYYSLEELKEILAKYPVEIVSLSTADDGKWLHVIFRKM